MPLAARVAHARLLLAAGRFSGTISGQPMVDPGRSDVKDSYGGGLNGRWWLMSENRRLEASVAADESRPVSGQIERRKRWNRPGFCFIWGRRPFCGGCQAWSGRRWEIGGERGSRRREERESPRWYYGMNACMVHRYRWTLCTVGSRMKRSDGCDWLDLQVDRTVWMSGALLWCVAVHRDLGTPGDVAQRYQSLDYFKGWDLFGF